MSLHKSLSAYLSSIKATMFAAELGEKGGYINFSNSGKRGDVKSFTISLAAFLSAFNDINNELSKFMAHQSYVEGDWRDLSENFSDLTIKSIVTVQTKPLFTTMSKLVAWANDRPASAYEDGTIEITSDSVAKTIEKLSELINCAIM